MSIADLLLLAGVVLLVVVAFLAGGLIVGLAILGVACVLVGGVLSLASAGGPLWRRRRS